MRHRNKRHLRGVRDRRRKELRALAVALLLRERIETTHARARISRSFSEKLITKGKTPGLIALRALNRDLPINAVKKVLEVLGPRYTSLVGGYTRILHAGTYKDGTMKVILELVK